MADDEGDQPAPIGTVLHGIEIHPLPDGCTPLDAVILVKSLDADGDTTWSFRRTYGLNDEETLGILVTRCDLMRKEFVELFEADDEDD